jgi:hypothetical protein
VIDFAAGLGSLGFEVVETAGCFLTGAGCSSLEEESESEEEEEERALRDLRCCGGWTWAFRDC